MKRPDLVPARLRRTRRARAGLVLSALGLVAVAGTTACMPQPAAIGTVEVIVTYEGQPVDATVTAYRTSGSQRPRTVRTGSDGKVTLTLPSLRWSLRASGPGVEFPDDPLCSTQQVSEPGAVVTIRTGQAKTARLPLHLGQAICV